MPQRKSSRNCSDSAGSRPFNGATKMAIIEHRLKPWFRKNGRSFPWRETRDPYRVLIAEMMLHRTLASQVVPVYERFLDQIPDYSRFLATSPPQIRRLLIPLGLKWRNDTVVELAKELKRQYPKGLPESRTELLKLPGVGEYTASAVYCFAYGRPAVLLDTNIVRVLGRLFSLPRSDSSRRSQKYRALLSVKASRAGQREFYFGLLDLAALLCRPAVPECSLCPLNRNCASFSGGVFFERGSGS